MSEPEPARPINQAVPAVKPAPPSNGSSKPRSTQKTVKLTDLLKAEVKSEERQQPAEKVLNEPFTSDQLRAAWDKFAQQRKNLQAEFQMLSQPYELRGNVVVVTLLSPVHETMLANIRLEITSFLREKLKNSHIQVAGELTTTDDKKVLYTAREKFEYLAEKNPILKELKDRLELDTDF